MIKKEFYKYSKHLGANIYRIFSDKKFLICQKESNRIDREFYDGANTLHEYVETDQKIKEELEI